MQSFSFLVFSLCFFITHQWCEKFAMKQSNQILSVSFSADNFYLAVVVKDTHVKIYSTLDYKLLKTYVYSGFKPQKVTFSQDGKYLGIAYDTNSVKILNALEPFDENLTLVVNHNSFTNDLDFNSGGLLMTCGNDNKLKLWTIVHGGVWTWLRQTTIASQTQTSCRFSPTGTFIAHGTTSNLWAYTTATLAQVGTKSGRRNRQAVWSRDETRIYAGTKEDTKLYQYIRSGFAETNLLSGDQFYTVDVSINSRYLITGGKNKVLYVYNETSFNHTMIYEMLFNEILWDAKFSRDSKMFAVGLKSSWFYIYSEYCIEPCESGTFYYPATKTCKKCSQLVANCSICENSTYCKECQVGFYFNKNTKLCSLCNLMEGCSICSLYNQCTSCAQGYTLNSSKLCEKCSKFLTGCNLCNTTLICINCLNQYFLDTTTHTCKSCQLSTSTSMTNCLRCNSSSFCIECMPGFYPTAAGLCAKCDNLCLHCEGTATNCSQCTLGYYVNPPTLYTCTACSYGCLMCNNSGFCFDCWDSMHEATDGTCQFCPFPCASCQNGTYCQTCAQHYFLNQTNNLCYRCENNCNTCNSSAYCSSCLQGYYLRTTDNTCQLCSILKPYCTQCNSTTCLSCLKGFYYSTVDTQCIKCISKMYQCVTCTSATVCKECAVGYHLTAGSGNSSCATCPKECQTCTSNLICTKCFMGYYLQASNNTCMSCEADHCTQCTAKAVCTYCEVGYYLQVSTKKCLICTTPGCYSCLQVAGVEKCQFCLTGYYLDATSQLCKECNSSCLTCATLPTQCSSCSIGYYLESAAKSCNLCPTNCSQCNDTTYCTACSYSYYLDSANHKCLHCTQKFNKSCITCNATNCLLCKSGFFLVNTTVNTAPQICKGCNETDIFCLECNVTACLKCSDGAYMDVSVTPQKCKACSSAMEGCRSCSSGATCIDCQIGSYLDTSTGKCKVCTVGCEQCTSPTACLRCAKNYYYSASTTSCILCSTLMNGCSQCPSQTLCSQCSNGFYLVPIDSTHSQCGYCSSSMGGCQYCNSTTVCTKCLTQYYLDSTLVAGSVLCSKCATAITGCQLCSNLNNCLKCESGYYLDAVSKLCYLCQVSLVGCIYCSSNGATCTTCQSGYYLSKTTNKCILCSTAQTGCQQCQQPTLGQINCLKSLSGFYLKTVGTLKQPSPCDAIYCDSCFQTDPTKCITCDSSYYLDPSTHTCLSCQPTLSGCLTCSSSLTCSSCDAGYWLNPSTSKCETCNSKYSNCLICTQSQCLKCKSLYIKDTLSNGCQTCEKKFPGCKYCNQTQCFYCSSNYYKSVTTNQCITCDTIPGCLVCDSYGVCLTCKQNYYLKPVTLGCVLCNSLMEGCFACNSPNVCSVCQSGYLINTNNTCSKVTTGGSSSAPTKNNLMKLATEYVSKDLLKHQLYSSQYDFSKIDLSKNLSKIQLFMKYTSNALAVKEPLKLLSYQWSNQGSKVLILYSNNPLNVTANKMSVFRRLLQQNKGSISLDDTTISVAIPKQLAQQMLPQAKLVGDTEVNYDLSDSSFYASYIRQSTMQLWHFIAFGYVVVVFLVVNYLIRSFVTDKSPQSDHGEIILHYLCFAAPCLIIYPTTVQVLSFCYGFMLLSFPWLNQPLGKSLGNSFDNSPTVMKLFYANLNVGSTYALALIVILVILLIGYCVIYVNSKTFKLKDENNSIFFNFSYNLFSYGALFSATLALQGCFMNPINQLFSFTNVANSLLYMAGILIIFLVFVDLVHSLCIDAMRYFYKLRNTIKTVLLALSHFNPVYFFSVLVILDLLFVAGEYFISKRQNKRASSKTWIAKNILLDIGLIILVFFSTKLIAVIICIGLIIIALAIQIYQHCMLSNQKRAIQKVKFNPKEYLKAADRTINTQFNDDQNYKRQNVWNVDVSSQANLPEITHTSIKDRPPMVTVRKNTARNQANSSSLEAMHQTMEYEPRRRRSRKQEPARLANSLTVHNFRGDINQPKEKVMQVKKKNRYDAADDDVERISDF